MPPSCCILEQSEMIPPVIWCDFYPASPMTCIITLLVDVDHSDYFNFSKPKETEKKRSRQNSYPQSALALKV